MLVGYDIFGKECLWYGMLRELIVVFVWISLYFFWVIILIKVVGIVVGIL